MNNTEKSRIEKEHELYEFLYENSEIMYASVSPTDATFLKVNSTLCNVLGYSKKEILGAPVFKVYHEDCKESVLEAFNQFKNEGFVKGKELILAKKNGEKVYVILNVSSFKDDDGAIIYSRSTWVDVTEIKLKELELSKLKDLLRNSNEAARIGTWEVDVVNQEIYWSSMTKDIHEVAQDYKPDLNRAIEFFKEGASREMISKSVQKAMEEGEGYNLDLQIITAKGNERWVRAIGLAKKEGDTCIGLYGTFQDIHEKKMADLKLNDVLGITNDQNKRLLNFAHIVSHNLRSHSGNLTMTMGFLKEENDKELKEDLMNMMETSIVSLGETIEHLNEVVIINMQESVSLVSLKLEDHLKGAISNVGALLKSAGGKIEASIPEGIRVHGIPAYLDSIFLNFLTNSIKYKSPERVLDIKVKAQKVNDKISISIADNGLGIDLKRNGSKIFGMYKTFNENKDARGIGLFITKNQIEAMGGKVEVKSELNKGTKFTIYLNEKN